MNVAWSKKNEETLVWVVTAKLASRLFRTRAIDPRFAAKVLFFVPLRRYKTFEALQKCTRAIISIACGWRLELSSLATLLGLWEGTRDMAKNLYLGG